MLASNNQSQLFSKFLSMSRDKVLLMFERRRDLEPDYKEFELNHNPEHRCTYGNCGKKFSSRIELLRHTSSEHTRSMF